MKQDHKELFEKSKNEFLSQGFSIARVISEHKELYTILVDGKEIKAEVTGKLMYTAESRKDFPVVGDWAAVQLYDENSPAIIHGILPRTMILSRKSAGKAFEEQILASNVEIVFVVHSLDERFNLRSLERYAVVVKESGAVPVILLSKSDLIDEQTCSTSVREAGIVLPDVQVIPYSAKNGTHIEEIRSLIKKDITVCFVGPSGAGKSTLINTLTGKNLLPTQKIREGDSKGRHTTTHRQLIVLPNGGFVIDTPGMRELGLWHVGDISINDAFPEIIELGSSCRFNDCSHVHEPGCTVLQAVAEGMLTRERYDSYIKLRKEAEYVASKTDVLKQQERKAKERLLHKDLDIIMKLKNKR